MRLLGRLATNTALVVLGLATALSLVELASRMGLARCWGKVAGVWEPHPLFGSFHRPGLRGWGQGCLNPSRIEWRSTIAIDAHGLHGRTHDYAKPAGTFRVLLLGDSFVEGFTVPTEDGIVARLEDRLAAAPLPGVRHEVLNGATAAWGTNNQLLFLTHEGTRYAPDVVVLAFNPSNDIGENGPTRQRDTQRALVDPYFVLRDGRLQLENFPAFVPPPATGWVAWADDVLWRRTHLYPLARLVLLGTYYPRYPAGREMRPQGVPEPEPGEPPAVVSIMAEPLPPRWAEAWTLTQELVREVRRRAEAGGARLLVAVVPSKFAVGGPRGNWLPRVPGLDVDPGRPERRAEAFLAAEGFRTCRLADALGAHLAATGRNGYYRWDIHWTAEGHAVAAEALAGCLAREGLLAPAATAGRAP